MPANNQQHAAEPDWRNLGPCPKLQETGRLVIKLEGLQIALFDTEDGIYAINNRCPHEGYPLGEGTTGKACTLACNWHGWVFDLKTGRALEGRDAVKTFPLERRDNDIWIDIAKAPSALRQARAKRELFEAMEEHDYDRLARSLARYEGADGAVKPLIVDVLNWSLPRLERGFGHTHAGLADWLQLAQEDPENRIIAFLEALGYFSWDCLTSGPMEIPDAAKEWSPAAFLQALEAMDHQSALALALAGVEEGLQLEDFMPLMRHHVFSHYMGFGHPAIYLEKAAQLTSLLGAASHRPIVLQLTKYLCVSAREDLIPEFRLFREMVDSAPGEGRVPSPEAFFRSSSRKAMSLALSASANREGLFQSLLSAAAVNMLGFRVGDQDIVEQPVAKNIGWLDFTHAITFAEAFHRIAKQDERVWQSGLMQMACFVGRVGNFVEEPDIDRWVVEDPQDFLRRQKRGLLDMDEGDYIFAVHRLKMIFAVEALGSVMSKPTARLVLAALNRYLHSRLRQRHPARTAFQAQETVNREG